MNILLYEDYTQAKPIPYTVLQKEYRFQRKHYNVDSYNQWQRSVLPDYAELVKTLTDRRLDKKDYLSLEERSDFIHCYYLLNKFNSLTLLPIRDRMRANELYSLLI